MFWHLFNQCWETKLTFLVVLTLELHFWGNFGETSDTLRWITCWGSFSLYSPSIERRIQTILARMKTQSRRQNKMLPCNASGNQTHSTLSFPQHVLSGSHVYDQTRGDDGRVAGVKGSNHGSSTCFNICKFENIFLTWIQTLLWPKQAF